MDKDMLLQRIKDLASAVDASVANHHGLVGRLNEAKEMLSMLKEEVPTAEVVLNAIEHSDVQE